MLPVHRHTARVLLVSPRGRVLLLRGHDPARREQPYWFTPGGGIEDGESSRAAAVRELHEETGILVLEDVLVGPIARDRFRYDYGDVAYVSHATFFACPLDERDVTPAGLPGEVITDARWWEPTELPSATLRNRRIPAVAALAVAAVHS